MSSRKQHAAMTIRFVGRTLFVLGAILAAGFEAFGLAAFVFLHGGPEMFGYPLFMGMALLMLGAIAEYVSRVMTRPRLEKKGQAPFSGHGPA